MFLFLSEAKRRKLLHGRLKFFDLHSSIIIFSLNYFVFDSFFLIYQKRVKLCQLKKVFPLNFHLCLKSVGRWQDLNV